MKLRTEKFIATIMFTALSFVIFGGAANFIHADYIPLASLPGTTDSKGSVNLNTYIPGIFNLTIGIAGVLAVLMIVIGGVEYMTTDAIQGKADGKARINNALWGLLLVLVSYILLYTINPRLTIFDLSVGETKSNQTNGIINNTNEQNYNNGTYNDGTNYIEGTANPLAKPNLDTSGIEESSSVDSGSNLNDGTNNIGGTKNPLYKPQLQY